MEELEYFTPSDRPDGRETILPPVDRGKDAYLFLTACFVFEALIWGMPSPENTPGHQKTKIMPYRVYLLVRDLPRLLQHTRVF